MTKFHAEFPNLCSISKDMQSAKQWITISSKTVTGLYDLLQFYSRLMFSQISSMFLAVGYTLLSVGRAALTVKGCGPKTGGVLGV